MTGRLQGDDLRQAQAQIIANHYTGSVPSGKSHYFVVGDAIVVFSIPANKNISRWLVREDNVVWELSRLWAPNGHEPNLLTQAVSAATKALRATEPHITALVSYADPNVGHEGGVYRAASWAYLGQCEETRAYRGAAGEIVSRRAFHSGSRSLRKAEIEALGYTQLKLPGKHRFARGLTAKTRKRIAERARA
jgi:hypothetical protein